MSWQRNLLTDPDSIQELLARTQRIAVLGIKPESEPFQPAYYVPEYLKTEGFEVVPVPVYYPDAREMLGAPVYRRLVDIPGEVDLVNVFRRGSHIPEHEADILAKRPEAVWFQLGIRNDASAEKFARAGIKVVQDRCLMIDHRRMRAMAH